MTESTQVMRDRVMKDYEKYIDEVPDSQAEHAANRDTMLSETRQVDKQSIGVT